jgi:site-specific recombinase XerD
MTLYDGRGGRKYLTLDERRAFASAALGFPTPTQLFCLTLLYTGAQISEVLALTPTRIDQANNAIVLETLKRRKVGVFRAIPVPPELVIRILDFVGSLTRPPGSSEVEPRIWNWGRTTAWKNVKRVMESAHIQTSLATPKAARHAFGVSAIQSGVALNIVQRWMGHARIETTSIYANVLGKEERALAERTWTALPLSSVMQEDRETGADPEQN